MEIILNVFTKNTPAIYLMWTHTHGTGLCVCVFVFVSMYACVYVSMCARICALCVCVCVCVCVRVCGVIIMLSGIGLSSIDRPVSRERGSVADARTRCFVCVWRRGIWRREEITHAAFHSAICVTPLEWSHTNLSFSALYLWFPPVLRFRCHLIKETLLLLFLCFFVTII